MVIKYNINDIVTYNHQGVFSVAIILRITVVSEGEVLYYMDNGADILEENITSYLGNARDISDRLKE